MGLLQRLFDSRRPDAATLSACQDRLDRACVLMDELSFCEASSLLMDALARLRDSSAAEAVPFRAALLSALGECHFQNGDPERAAAATYDALRQGKLAPDLEQSVLGNLYEIHRYLGQANEAAVQADRLADLAEKQGQLDEASRYRRQANLVRAGEPPCRVVVAGQDRRLELDEALAGVHGRLSFLIERNRLLLRSAQHHLDTGLGMANEGRFAEALSLFRAASRCDRFAPQPHLQAGLMHLYLRQAGEAMTCLQECERLAPGWPLARPALWLARLRADERIPHEVFLHWHSLEEAPLPAEMKIRLADQALERAPRLPHLHHLQGKNLRERNLGFAAERAYRRALELNPPPDLETRLCVDLAAVVDDPSEKRRLLAQAIALDADLMAVATAKIVLQFD
jgi:tetratricopeptide (TPR) repeat protein